MSEIEPRSVYGRQIPDENQRESAMEDSSLRFALFKTGREVKRKLTRKPKTPQKPLINDHGRSL